MRSTTILFLAVLATAPARAVKITEFPLPHGGSPHHLAAGPDGRIWFCEYSGDRVGAMTTAGALQEYPIRAGAGCSGIAAVSRWLIFTETSQGRYGYIDALNGGQGDTSAFLSSPLAIATGRDGRYWITQAGGSSVYANPWASKPLPNDYATVTAASHPYGVALGPDGRMWVTEFSVSKIGACDPGGTTCVEYPIPAGAGPDGIVAGPDGRMWFTERYANAIGRMTPAGVYDEFPLPTTNAGPYQIALGPDGNLWFTEVTANQIGRITPQGVVTEFPIPTADSGPYGIALGPDGNLWFTENFVDKIARLTVFVPGDVNGDGDVNVNDVFYLINFLFAGGPAPK